MPNTAKEPVKATCPVMARPAATSTMFCSAMPQLNRRSAKPASASFFVVVDPVRSASTATTGTPSDASSASVAP